MAKPWPQDGSPASFAEIVEPLCQLVEQAYHLRRKPLRDLDYQGLERGSLHILPPVEESLSVEQLRYDDEEQGRQALEVIIGLAVQLGIEQGRRVVRQELDPCFLSLKIWPGIAESDLKLAAEELAQALEMIRDRLPKDGVPR